MVLRESEIRYLQKTTIWLKRFLTDATAEDWNLRVMRLKIALLLMVVVLATAAALFYSYVDFRTIPQSRQRYPTVGDWWIDAKGWHFRISQLPKRRYELLVFIHEFTELTLCRLTRVAQARVDAFDMAYEARRRGKKVLIPGKADSVLFDDPGDDPAAPYHYQHLIASAVERAAAALLLVDWRTYNKAIDDSVAAAAPWTSYAA